LWFHRHFAPVAYRGAVVVSGEIVSVTLERALFFVGGQLRRSRSAQAVSDAQITNRIRAFGGFPIVMIYAIRYP
jgi:hypothetical protein